MLILEDFKWSLWQIKRAFFFFPSLILSIKTKQTLPIGHLYLFFWVKLLALQKYNKLEGTSLLLVWRWWHWHEVVWQGIKVEKYWWQSVSNKRISLKKRNQVETTKSWFASGIFPWLLNCSWESLLLFVNTGFHMQIGMRASAIPR